MIPSSSNVSSIRQSSSSSSKDGFLAQSRRRFSSTTMSGMDYIRRVFNKSQMDFQYALWQMKSLITSPKSVYNATRTRKHQEFDRIIPAASLSVFLIVFFLFALTKIVRWDALLLCAILSIDEFTDIKNQWARDDPAFVVIMVAGMLISSLVHTLIFGERTLRNILVVILETLFFDFGLVSMVFSFIYWFSVNKKLLRRKNDASAMSLLSMEYNRQLSSDEMVVEWQYAFDIHCNAYFVYFLLSNVLVFLLVPLLLLDSWISLILGNTVYLIACMLYFYIAFLGYDALPMVQNTQTLLYPIPAVMVLYLVTLLTHFNISHTLLKLHYGYDV